MSLKPKYGSTLVPLWRVPLSKRWSQVDMSLGSQSQWQRFHANSMIPNQYASGISSTNTNADSIQQCNGSHSVAKFPVTLKENSSQVLLRALELTGQTLKSWILSFSNSQPLTMVKRFPIHRFTFSTHQNCFALQAMQTGQESRIIGKIQSIICFWKYTKRVENQSRS